MAEPPRSDMYYRHYYLNGDVMLKNFKLATKLYLSFGGIAPVTLFLGLFGYYGCLQSCERAIQATFTRNVAFYTNY